MPKPILAVFSEVEGGEDDSTTRNAKAHATKKSGNAQEYVPDQLLVSFKTGVSYGDSVQVIQALGARVLQVFDSPAGLYLIQLPKGISVGQAESYFKRNMFTSGAEPNYLFRAASLPDDPYFSRQWALNNIGQDGALFDMDINALEAWALNTGDEEIVLGVIDSGVDYTHVDLRENIWHNPDEIPGNGIDDDGNGWVDDIHGIDTASGDSDPLDENGHGTHVAGIIAARGNNGEGVTGVMWNTRLAVCRFLGDDGVGSTSSAIGCLNYFADLKKRGVNIVATNNSWGGGGYSEFLYQAIHTHLQEGILLIAAAGNGECEYSHYPASYDWENIISVGATEESTGSDFLCVGDVHAPGRNIFSTLPANTYGYATGTSMATPFVTGIAGLYKAHQPGLESQQLKQRILDTALSTYASRYPMARLKLPDEDVDNDGMRDAWEARHGLDASSPGDAAQDPDEDGLDNFAEFTHKTDPHRDDTDGDGLKDGDEVVAYNTNPLRQDSDGDTLSDAAEVLTYQTDPNQRDTDADGLTDAEEIQSLGTDPLQADSDGDTMPDGWEVAYGLDPLSASDATGDSDGDGLANAEEVLYGSAPDSTDSDSDGISDVDEIQLRGTDPGAIDSDGDRLPDSWEIVHGLDPLQPDDARLDQDGDGYDALREFLSASDPAQEGSIPPFSGWLMHGGNTAQNRFIPIRVDLSAAALRWRSHNIALDDNSEIIVSREQVLVKEHYARGLLSFSPVDGRPLWGKSLATGLGPEWRPSALASPAINGEQVIVTQARNNPYTSAFTIPAEHADQLIALDASSGEELFRTTLTRHTPGPATSDYAAKVAAEAVPSPVATDAHYYIKDGDTLTKFGRATGELLWQSHVGDTRGFWSPVLVGDLVLGVSEGALVGFDTQDGTRKLEWFGADCRYGNNNRIAAYGTTAVVHFGGCLFAYDIEQQRQRWRINASDANALAVDDRSAYVLSEGELRIYRLNDGALRHAIEVFPGGDDGSLVVTLDYVFVSGAAGTAAVNVDSGNIDWRYAKGGQIAITDDGALVINSGSGQLLSVDLEGDRDGDGLPGWWERHNGLNPRDAGDADWDNDADGIVNIDEYILKTDPNETDSDGDGIEDGVEHNTLMTDPADADSDGDGLSDGSEQSYGTDFLAADSDGDGVSDGEEIQVFSTDPLDAGSQPQRVVSSRESFERGLPAHWMTPEYPIPGWMSDPQSATDGTRSLKSDWLETGEVADVTWSQSFLPGTLAFDAKIVGESCCDTLRVYIDDILELTILAGDWQRHTIAIPGGFHTLKWSFVRNSGEGYNYSAAWLDNVVLTTSAPMAISKSNVLAFHKSTLYEFDPSGKRVGVAVSLPGIEQADDMVMLANRRLLIANGETFHIYNLLSGHLSSFENPAGNMGRCSNSNQSLRMHLHGQSIFFPYTQCNAGYGIAQMSVEGELLATLFPENRYLDVIGGPENTLYALRTSDAWYNWGQLIEIIDIESRAVTGTIYTDVPITRMFLTERGTLFASASGTSGIFELDSQGRLLSRSEDSATANDFALSAQGPLYISRYNNLGTLRDWPSVQWFSDGQIGSSYPPYSSIVIASIRLDGEDRDADGMPDWWEATYGLDVAHASNGSEDRDGDGLLDTQEFANGSNPLESDSDHDGLTDLAEVENYRTNPASADSDGDGIGDDEEVNVYATNPNLTDSDADGIDDLEEISAAITDPRQADSDSDGLADGWELHYALDPANSTDAGGDQDGDGLNNLEEHTAGTDPTLPDTDFDGLTDEREVEISGTSALVRDTDGDRLSDAWEVAFNLDPLDPVDAADDSDGDGHSNQREYFSGTSPRDQSAYPVPQPWTTTGGDSRHRGHVPVSLNLSDFSERWSIDRISENPLEVPNQVKVSQGRIIVSEYNSYWDSVDLTVQALDAMDGSVMWQHSFGELRSVQEIALSRDAASFFSRVMGWGDTAYHTIDLETGALKSLLPENISGLAGTAPLTHFDDRYYSYNLNTGQLTSLDPVTGEPVWSDSMDLARNSLVNPAVDEHYVYGYVNRRDYGIRMLDRETGALVRDIPLARLNDEPWQWFSPVLGAQGNVIAAFNLGFDGGLLASFNTGSGATEWSRAGEFRGQPAYANGVVYVIESQGLLAIDELSGQILWRWQSSEAPLLGAPLVTDTHVFVTAQTEVWALDLATQQPVWRYGRGGRLSMGEDGALYIAGFDGGLSAIQIQPLDADNDGMADWWESLHGLNPMEDDQSHDPDGDGASNAQEYSARTHPQRADTDGDGLADGEEILVLTTNPRLPDSDRDGLNDGEEINEHGSDPLQQDSDGDGLADAEEIRTYGTSAVNADTDQDGMDDAFELLSQLDPLAGEDAAGDADNDGLNNLVEYGIGSDLYRADTDGDGLDDGVEALQLATNPLLADSDSDRIPDDRELAFGLDPLDAGDATLDQDNDGFLNIEEYFATSDLADSQSLPEISPWRIERGSTRFDSYVPLSLSPDNFRLRWRKDLDGDKTTAFSNVVTSGEYAALVGYGRHSLVESDFLAEKRVLVLDTRSGEEVWNRKLDSFNEVGAPAIENGSIYVATRGVDRLLGLNLESGRDTLNTSFNTVFHYWYLRAPVPIDGTLFVERHNRGLVGYDTRTGEETFRYPNGMRAQLAPVDDQYVYHLSGGSGTPLALTVLDRNTAEVVFSIDTGIEQFYRTPNFTPLLTSSKKLILVHDNQAIAFDLKARKVAWHKTFLPAPEWYFAKKYEDYFAHANGVLYLIHDGKLLAISDEDGKELWRWDEEDFDITQNMVVTNDHIFVGTSQKTMALSLHTREVAWSYPVSGTLSLDDNGLLYIVAADGSVHAIDLEGDSDSDGIPDWWERKYRMNPRNAGDISADPDNDGLTALEEYQWQTSPQEMDSDNDGLNDGWEVQAVGSNPKLADSDDDGLSDGDEVNIHGSNPIKKDSDDDGLADWEEVVRYHSNPVEADSDMDGLADGIEVSVGLNPSSGGDAAGDLDGDGLANLDEHLFGTKLDAMDTDGDGLSDGQEKNEHFTSPLLPDTDGDRMPDQWEIQYGLDARRANAEGSDHDNDGYPDIVEFALGTSPASAGSMPAVTPWTGLGGDSGHTGFVPVRIDPEKLLQSWSVRVLENFYHQTSSPASRDGVVYVSHRGPNKKKYISAYETGAGGKKWQKSLGYGKAVSPPAAGSHGPWLFVEGQGILGLDRETGSTNKNAFAYLEPTNYVAPTIAGGMLYGYSNVPSNESSAYSLGRLFGLDTASGEITWIRNRLAWSGWSPAVGSRYLFEYSPLAHQQFSVTDKVSGKKHLVIEDPEILPAPLTQGVSPVLTLSGAVLIQGGRLVSFDLACRCKNWELPGNFHGLPAYAPGKIFAINGNDIVVIDELSGSELRRYSLSGESPTGQLLVTLSHLFVTTTSKVVAVNLTSGLEEWAYAAAGRMALGNDQRLIIATATGELVGILLEPDGDTDGMPDAWEIAYGLNPNDSDDAQSDPDGDSLRSIQEFYLGASPAAADTDGDGVGDYIEQQEGTGLSVADTDRDGLDDGWERSQSGTDPLQMDSDGDGLSDHRELALYASSPLLVDTDADGYDDAWEVRALSGPANGSTQPGNLEYAVVSFEQGALPAGWSHAKDTENSWVVVREKASDGEYALHSSPHNIIPSLENEETSGIQWTARFPAGNMLFDFLDSQFISRAELVVYIDDDKVLELEALERNWSTYYLPVTEGRHTIRWEYAQNTLGRFDEMSGAVIDNIRLQAEGADSDGDGMPDSWEIDYRLNIDDPADAQEDPDSDGVNNLQEYHRGTDPRIYDTGGESSSGSGSSGGSNSSSSSGGSSGSKGSSSSSSSGSSGSSSGSSSSGSGSTSSGSGSSGAGSSGTSGSGGNSGGGSGGAMSPELLIVLMLFLITARSQWWRQAIHRSLVS